VITATKGVYEADFDMSVRGFYMYHETLVWNRDRAQNFKCLGHPWTTMYVLLIAPLMTVLLEYLNFKSYSTSINWTVGTGIGERWNTCLYILVSSKMFTILMIWRWQKLAYVTVTNYLLCIKHYVIQHINHCLQKYTNIKKIQLHKFGAKQYD